MRLALATDHHGVELKALLATQLAADGHEVLDLGTDSRAPVDYPDFAAAVGRAVREGRAERGVLICGSGVGASIAANKLPEVRAGLCHDTYSARQGVEHDDMNVLVLGARVVGTALAADLVRAFVGARFSGAERHQRRLAKVRALERPAPSAPSPAWRLPPALEAAVRASLADWEREGRVARLWAGDARLWTGADEASWLGWLGIPAEQRARLAELEAAAADARAGGFAHAVVLGMGGSSLCPEVLALTFGRQPGAPALAILDSTDPAQIRALEARLDLARTLFIVASKSGSTLEPNIFMQHFLARVRATVGPAEAGRRFLAVTDPGSAMQKAAEAEGFRRVHFGRPSIGGRYSALSDFGMIPAAVMGLDVGRLLAGADAMAHACAAGVPAAENPGLVLGTVLGVAARQGRDKVTLVASPAIGDVGAWLEQLLAESTGKGGRGLIPVDRETPGPAAVYGADRLFAYLRLETAPDPAQDAAVAALEQAGQPVVRVTVPDPYAVAAEFFRWEFATAVAGAILGVNPFDQPDVEASKVATRALTDAYARTGALPPEAPLLVDGDIAVFADPANAAALAGAERSLAGHLRAHLARLGPGDYFALLAYVEMSAAHERTLQALRHRVRDARRVATCLGFGPRFLHSTGQAYKGGPPSGVFVQVTAADAADLPVPEQPYTFGVVKAAQARGDLAVLAERGRRALRVHLGPDVGAGLAALDRAAAQALG